MLYIGIDLGTSAVKLLLMKEDGTVEKIVTKEYPLSFPHPGWSEHRGLKGADRGVRQEPDRRHQLRRSDARTRDLR
jgi:glycerol kinase